MNIQPEKKCTSEIINRTLRLKDSNYNHMLLVTHSALLYKYTEEWIKTEIEGTLYIYRRNTIPSTQLIILNRKTPEDFKLSLDSSLIEIQIEDQFIIVKKETSPMVLEVFGLWFYDTQSFIEVSIALTDHLNSIKQSRELLGLIRGYC
ncbi:hypothetical protein NEOKW01_0435 [Nematocida sp. AWRm80]|nr:hypothetical protein NEOKW01_0435 [Nematocida sp. AWRm80]